MVNYLYQHHFYQIVLPFLALKLICMATKTVSRKKQTHLLPIKSIFTHRPQLSLLYFVDVSSFNLFFNRL